MRIVVRWSAVLLVLLFGVSALAPRTQAQTAATPQSRAQIQLSFAPLVKQSAPAVVNIYTRKLVQQNVSPFLNDPIFQRFFGFEGAPGGLTRERVQKALGSGVIVDPQGVIVTAHHVINGADEITVALADRREFPAKVVLDDERTDLALLKIDTKGESLPHLKLMDSDQLQVGDLVLAIGNPFGVGQTVTMGIVSATARTDIGSSDYNFFIQTDAAINPGNSGGALITMDGSLAGINAAIYSRDGGSLGIGFAIPSDMVQRLLDVYHGGGKLTRPWSGITAQDVTPDIATSLSLPRPLGALVTKLDAASPGGEAGLKTGDVVVSINGKDVEDSRALKFRLGTMPVGATAHLSVIRGGHELTIDLPLIAAPEVPPRHTTHIKDESPLAGATVANLSPAVDDELGMDSDQRGVVITGIDDGSAAARLGFQKGDIVESLQGEEIKSVADLDDALAANAHGWRLAIKRGSQTISVNFGR